MSQNQPFISRIDLEIKSLQDKINKFEEKKKNFLELADKFPNIKLEYGSGYFHTKDNIYPQVSCMNLHNFYDTITAEFFISPTKTNGYKIFVSSNERYSKNHFIIASMSRIDYRTRARGITVLNYEKLISDDCPNKKKFLKRIKIYLMKKIKELNLTLDPASFNYEIFSKLLMLK